MLRKLLCIFSVILVELVIVISQVQADDLTCLTCHNAHDILPAGSVGSSINSKNLVNKCKECHPGANTNFVSGSKHVEPSLKQNQVLYMVKIAYIFLIIALMGAFCIYIILDLRATGSADILWRRRKQHENGTNRERYYVRMSLNQRIQHILLIFSFFTLAITGLPVVFPESPLSKIVIDLLGGFIMRTLLHKLAAVLLICLAIYHIFYVALSRSGNMMFRAFLPRQKDIHDAFHMIKYFLRKTPNRPKFDRYNYIEKFEYFAVVWGSILMIVTGSALWFYSQTMMVAPKWMLDIIRIVHRYEAILATLTIIIWHFYHVLLKPDVFPMSRVWLTGKISESTLKANHQIEYEQIINGQSDITPDPDTVYISKPDESKGIGRRITSSPAKVLPFVTIGIPIVICALLFRNIAFHDSPVRSLGRCNLVSQTVLKAGSRSTVKYISAAKLHKVEKPTPQSSEIAVKKINPHNNGVPNDSPKQKLNKNKIPKNTTSNSMHPDNWSKKHSSAALSESSKCTVCHKERFCISCHKNTAPAFHEDKDWMHSHNKTSASDLNKCAACHSTSFCSECHRRTKLKPHRNDAKKQHIQTQKNDTSGVCQNKKRNDTSNTKKKTSAHDTNWIKEHGVNAQNARETCMKCHSEEYCNDCHSDQ